MADVEFDGISRSCHMAFVPDAEVGDFVIVHAGVAISRIDAEEARTIFEELDRTEREAWQAGSGSEPSGRESGDR
ncbi:MAG: HypC/HybG/HupF family hydrogenase formation chaperone [Planctomycetaceae bacterium]